MEERKLMTDVKVVRVLIEEPNKVKRFKGTAFFINKNTLITAKHVIEEAIEYNYKIYLSDIPGGGKLPVSIDSIKLCKRDIAVINLKREFDIPPILFSKNIKIGLDVELIGYHDEDGARNQYKHNISGYLNDQHTYEIQDARTEGLSGSPILFDGKVCGITQAISTDKGVTYIIPISECCCERLDRKLILKSNTIIFKYVTMIALIIILFLFLIFQFKTTDNKINPIQTSSQQFNKKGEELYHKMRYDEAIKYYKKAIEENSKYAQAYSNLGLVYRKTHQYKNAILASEEAIKVATGEQARIVRASSYYNIARIKEEEKKWQEALDNFVKALLENEHKMYNDAIDRIKEKLKDK